MQSKSNIHFHTAGITAGILAIIAGIFLLIGGKFGSFQWINGHHNATADFIFRYLTELGGGLVWIVPGLYCIFFKRSYLIALLCCIVISTVLTHVFKQVILPNELRPVGYLAADFPVHLVEGVRIHHYHSFPSGHTSQAFTMALFLSHLISRKFIPVLLPVLALGIGYSRIYLAQHFLNDVLVGICIGIVAAYLSFLIAGFLPGRKTHTPETSIPAED